MEVDLDAFSGRPNPKWTISEHEASRLLTDIASLPEAKDVPHPPDLGFRGFILRSGDVVMRVYGGRVVVEGPGTPRVYRDTAGIERELIKDARKRGFEAIVRDFGQR
jgi:hypothetical protein